jgi:hypothetical protein
MNGPRESPLNGSTNRPWSGRLRHNSNPTNTGDASYKGYSHVDGESSGSE